MNSSVPTLQSLVERLPAFVEAGNAEHAVSQMLDALSNVAWPTWEEVVTRLQAASAPANIALLKAAHARWPERSDVAFLLGNHLRMRGEFVAAEQVLRDAIRQHPGDINAGLSLSYLLREQGRLNAANQTVLETWQNAPRSRSADMATLNLLCENQGHAMASSIVPEVVESNPSNGAALALAGEIELLLGHFEQAAGYLRRAVEIDPSSAASWLRLAQTHRFESRDDPDYGLLTAAHEKATLPDTTRSAIGFALANAENDLGDPAAAVKLLRIANAAERKRMAWNRDEWSEFARNEAQATPLLGTDQAVPFTPVFMVGMPRSGTTLAAELLSGHSAVHNRGELNWIASIAGRIGPSPDRAALRLAGQMIATQLQRDDAPAQVYIDKNPLNFRHLRLIAALFPQARIIHCRRGRRDTALSIWSQHFEHADLAWTYDFDDIAAFETGYRQLMATAPRFNLPTFDLEYAALVGDTESTLAKLHKFLGLPAHPATAAPREEKAIATASVWQARQPLHRDSLDRWKLYAEFLPELTRATPER
ncbi:MAG: sulfotransferase [Dokdonella sp.]